jgi:hypothetical protein
MVFPAFSPLQFERRNRFGFQGASRGFAGLLWELALKTCFPVSIENSMLSTLARPRAFCETWVRIPLGPPYLADTAEFSQRVLR